MIEHCISASLQSKKEQSYQHYVAECLRVITENTARFGGGSYIKAKLQDILNPKPVDNRTAKEIVEGIRKKL